MLVVAAGVLTVFRHRMLTGTLLLSPSPRVGAPDQDLNAVIWLEDYLVKYKGTVLIVSHDQDFLAAVTTDIIHLENQKLQYYKCDFYDYKKQHALVREKLKKVMTPCYLVISLLSSAEVSHRCSCIPAPLWSCTPVLRCPGLREAGKAAEGAEGRWKEQQAGI